MILILRTSVDVTVTVLMTSVLWWLFLLPWVFGADVGAMGLERELGGEEARVDTLVSLTDRARAAPTSEMPHKINFMIVKWKSKRERKSSKKIAQVDEKEMNEWAFYAGCGHCLAVRNAKLVMVL